MLNIYRRAKAEAGSGSTTGRLSWAPSSTTWAPPARRSARRGRPWTPTCRRNTPTRSASCWSTRWRQTPSLRLSYVRKDLSGDSGIWNTPQQTALLAGRGIACTADPAWDCPLNALTGAPLTVQRVPDDVAGLIDNRIAAFPGMESAYDTLQASVNLRFTGGFLLQASVDYQWRDEFRAADSESRSPLYADPLVVGIRRPRPDLAEPRPRRGRAPGHHQLERPPAGALHATVRRRPGRQPPAPERLAVRADPARGHPRHRQRTSRSSWPTCRKTAPTT